VGDFPFIAEVESYRLNVAPTIYRDRSEKVDFRADRSHYRSSLSS